MKQLLAYIFILIFSFQVLPVKELGKLLMKGNLTEEIKETDASEGKLKGKSEEFKLSGFNDFDGRTRFFNHQVHVAILGTELLPSFFIPDILTPPPNFSC